MIAKPEWTAGDATPALLSPRSVVRKQSPAGCTKKSAALAVTWKNCIKEGELDLFADLTSAAAMRANQLRLWFSSIAYVLLHCSASPFSTPTSPKRLAARTEARMLRRR